MTQDFWEYHANGDVGAGPISDNYIFTANTSAVRAYKAVEMEIIPGKIVTEIRQRFFRSGKSTFNSKVFPVKKPKVLPVHRSREESDRDYAFSITTRVPECYGTRVRCHRLEQTYSLGPLRLNTEVVLRSSTSLQNNRTVFTDDNGYQMMERRHRTFVNNTVARVRSLDFGERRCFPLHVVYACIPELLPHGPGGVRGRPPQQAGAGQ